MKKLRICALLSKFNKFDGTYSITMMYGNADTNCYPVPITGIKDSDCTTHGSHAKASRIGLTNGKMTAENYALESFRAVSLSDLIDIINMLEKETENEEFSICGDIDVRKLVNAAVNVA